MLPAAEDIFKYVGGHFGTFSTSTDERFPVENNYSIHVTIPPTPPEKLNVPSI